jgi:hypothetical protein
MKYQAKPVNFCKSNSNFIFRKEKNNQVNSSTMDEVNTKINKFNL